MKQYRLAFHWVGPLYGTIYFKVQKKRWGIWWTVGKNLTESTAKQVIAALRQMELDKYDN